MFSGEYDHNLDEKGRIFLPAAFREALGDSVVLTRGYDGQLDLFPFEAWRQKAEEAARQDQKYKEARDIHRLRFAVSECQVDKQGRIVISPNLRKFADLGSIVTIVGVNNHLEIWSQERWQQVTERLLNEGPELEEKLSRKSTAGRDGEI